MRLLPRTHNLEISSPGPPAAAAPITSPDVSGPLGWCRMGAGGGPASSGMHTWAVEQQSSALPSAAHAASVLQPPLLTH